MARSGRVARVMRVVGAVTVSCVGGAAPGAAQSVPGARELVDALEGTPPVACAIVMRAFANRWGPGTGRARVDEPLAANPTERALSRWVWNREPSASDVDVLFGAIASGDPCVRRVAATLLGVARDRAVEGRLRDRALQANGAEQLAAILALSDGRDPASEAVLRELLSSGRPDVRRGAAWALGERESQESVTALAVALDDPDEVLRRNVAWALGRIESPEAVPALVRAVQDPSAGVRVNAAWALGVIEDANAIPALASLLESDRNVEVRTTAAWALSRVGG